MRVFRLSARAPFSEEIRISFAEIGFKGVIWTTDTSSVKSVFFCILKVYFHFSEFAASGIC